MKKINYIYVLMLFLLISSVFAQTLEYPYYMDVNVTEQINVQHHIDDISENMYIFFEGTLNNMTNSADDTYSYVLVTSSIEEDIPFRIIGANATSFERYNDSDGNNEDSYSVTDNFKYVFPWSHLENISILIPGKHEVCVNISVKSGIQYRLVSGLQINDSNNIAWDYSSIFTSSDDSYGYKCAFLSYSYPAGIYNATEYVGFECLNCGLPNKLFIALDTTNISNSSKIFSTDFVNSSANFTTGNFDFFGLNFQNTVFYEATGVMRFRIPFYLTINLLKNKVTNTTEPWASTETEAYCNEFQYIYFQLADGRNDLPLQDMSYLDSWFSWMPYYSNSFTVVQDNKTSFWDKYENCEAIIKLYEAGNYTMTLLSTKTMGLSWDEEFIYPQIGDKLTKSKLFPDADPIKITEEVNSTVSIYASQFEVNKFNFIANLGFNMLIILGAIGIIVLSVQTKSAKLAIILIPIWITFMKLLGSAIL